MASSPTVVSSPQSDRAAAIGFLRRKGTERENRRLQQEVTRSNSTKTVIDHSPDDDIDNLNETGSDWTKVRTTERSAAVGFLRRRGIERAEREGELYQDNTMEFPLSVTQSISEPRAAAQNARFERELMEGLRSATAFNSAVEHEKDPYQDLSTSFASVIEKDLPPTPYNTPASVDREAAMGFLRRRGLEREKELRANPFSKQQVSDSGEEGAPTDSNSGFDEIVNKALPEPPNDRSVAVGFLRRRGTERSHNQEDPDAAPAAELPFTFSDEQSFRPPEIVHPPLDHLNFGSPPPIPGLTLERISVMLQRKEEEMRLQKEAEALNETTFERKLREVEEKRKLQAQQSPMDDSVDRSTRRQLPIGFLGRRQALAVEAVEELRRRPTSRADAALTPTTAPAALAYAHTGSAELNDATAYPTTLDDLDVPRRSKTTLGRRMRSRSQPKSKAGRSTSADGPYSGDELDLSFEEEQEQEDDFNGNGDLVYRDETSLDHLPNYLMRGGKTQLKTAVDFGTSVPIHVDPKLPMETSNGGADLTHVGIRRNLSIRTKVEPKVQMAIETLSPIKSHPFDGRDYFDQYINVAENPSEDTLKVETRKRSESDVHWRDVEKSHEAEKVEMRRRAESAPRTPASVTPSPQSPTPPFIATLHNRKYLHQSRAWQVITTSTVKDRYLFLFTDVLVIAKLVSPSFSSNPDDSLFVIKSIHSLRSTLLVLKLHAEKARTISPIVQSGIRKFSRDPIKSVAWMISKNVLACTPEAISYFLHSTPGLCRRMLGRFLCVPEHGDILRAWMAGFWMGGRVDECLRLMLGYIIMPNATAIPGGSGGQTPMRTFLEAFAKVYWTTNKDRLTYSRESCLTLGRYIVTLWKSFDHDSRPTLAEFVDNYRKRERKDVLKSIIGMPGGAIGGRGGGVGTEELRATWEGVISEPLEFSEYYGEVREIRVSVEPPDFAPFEEDGWDGAVLIPPFPSRLTLHQESPTVYISIPYADPQLRIHLHATNIEFSQPVLTFTNSNVASFTMKPSGLGRTWVFFEPRGASALTYERVERAVTVEPMFLKYSMQVSVPADAGAATLARQRQMSSDPLPRKKYLFALSDSAAREAFISAFAQCTPPIFPNRSPARSATRRRANSASSSVSSSSEELGEMQRDVALRVLKEFILPPGREMSGNRLIQEVVKAGRVGGVLGFLGSLGE
ncbi:hypothetical protein HDU85_003711 [Gaertneriomyces sp. JEL0708]|nr:hypothetical protein HDU85_003711 [Gaertneriomyces sp. JEL0708]